MQLFALVRGETPRIHRVQLHQELQGPIQQLFREQGHALLDDKTAIPFQAGHHPESDELHYIQPFDNQENFFATAQDGLQAPIFQDAMLDHLVGLFAIVQIAGVASAVFQTFERRRALQDGRLTIVRIGQGFRRLEQTGFVLDSHAAAVVQGNRLLFSSFSAAGRIFDLTEYFHEATDTELESFTELSAVLVTDPDQFKKLADISRIRKQVTLVLESGILDKVRAATIARLAQKEANLTIKTTGTGRKCRLVMPDTRAELRKVLDFLLENYFQGPLTGTRFVANSKIVAT